MDAKKYNGVKKLGINNFKFKNVYNLICRINVTVIVSMAKLGKTEFVKIA